jgi:hypothetical protein
LTAVKRTDAKPMPPAAAIPAEEVTTIEAWANGL